MGGREKEQDDGLGRWIALATGAAGLVAYLYFLGGVVTWLRLATARLSGDGGIVATDSKRLLAVGARVAVFELLLLFMISAIVIALVGFAIRRRGGLPVRSLRDIDDLTEGWSNLWTLGGMIVPTIALLSIVIGLSAEPPVVRVGLLILGLSIGLLVGLAMIFGDPPKGKELCSDDADEDWSPPWRRQIVELGRLIRGERGEEAAKRAEKMNGTDDAEKQKAIKEAEERASYGIRWIQRAAALLFVLTCGVAVALVPLLQGTMLLAGVAVIYAGPFVTWPRSSGLQELTHELLRSSGVWLGIAAATAVALAWVATPPVAYQRATLLIDGQSASFPGAYLDRAADGTYLGRCTSDPLPPARGDGAPSSTRARIEFVAESAQQGAYLGGRSYQFDPGGRPSLLQAASAALGGPGAARESAPLHHALRGRPDGVCGQ